MNQDPFSDFLRKKADEFQPVPQTTFSVVEAKMKRRRRKRLAYWWTAALLILGTGLWCTTSLQKSASNELLRIKAEVQLPAEQQVAALSIDSANVETTTSSTRNQAFKNENASRTTASGSNIAASTSTQNKNFQKANASGVTASGSNMAASTSTRNKNFQNTNTSRTTASGSNMAASTSTQNKNFEQANTSGVTASASNTAASTSTRNKNFQNTNTSGVTASGSNIASSTSTQNKNFENTNTSRSTASASNMAASTSTQNKNFEQANASGVTASGSNIASSTSTQNKNFEQANASSEKDSEAKEVASTSTPNLASDETPISHGRENNPSISDTVFGHSRMSKRDEKMEDQPQIASTITNSDSLNNDHTEHQPVQVVQHQGFKKGISGESTGSTDFATPTRNWELTLGHSLFVSWNARNLNSSPDLLEALKARIADIPNPDDARSGQVIQVLVSRKLGKGFSLATGFGYSELHFLQFSKPEQLAIGTGISTSLTTSIINLDMQLQQVEWPFLVQWEHKSGRWGYRFSAGTSLNYTLSTQQYHFDFTTTSTSIRTTANNDRLQSAVWYGLMSAQAQWQFLPRWGLRFGPGVRFALNRQYAPNEAFRFLTVETGLSFQF